MELKYNLQGGGNSNLVDCHPYLGKIPILTIIFFRWVETTNQSLTYIKTNMAKVVWLAASRDLNHDPSFFRLLKEKFVPQKRLRPLFLLTTLAWRIGANKFPREENVAGRDTFSRGFS